MRIEIQAVEEDEPGAAWSEILDRHLEAYLRWYQAPGGGERPTYLECERALKRYLPEWLPIWRAHCEAAGGDDVVARFLSLYRPPAYVQGCSQVAWNRPEPRLIRNYDYAPELWDGVLFRSAWTGRRVLAVTDCLIGALDGVNEAGLSVSLSFGGSQEVGDGFGAPLLVRVALETCRTAAEAAQLFRRVPTHMAYNILMLDRDGDFFTAFTGPSRPTIVRRTAASTNHQDRIAWARHAWATATLERERRLHACLADPEMDGDTLEEAFLHPPLRSTDYARGFGTLYTAVYRPAMGRLDLRWPGHCWSQSLDDFTPGTRTVELPGAHPGSRTPNPQR